MSRCRFLAVWLSCLILWSQVGRVARTEDPPPTGGFSFVTVCDPRPSNFTYPTGRDALVDDLNQIPLHVPSGWPFPTFVLYVGDVDDPAVTEEAIGLATQSVGELCHVFAIGNHEVVPYYIPQLKDHYPDMVATLPIGASITMNGLPPTNDTMYVLEYGNAAFVLLDIYYNGSNWVDTGVLYDPVMQFADTALAATDKPVKFVLYHEPCYPDFRHEGDSLDADPVRRDEFWDLLTVRGVSVTYTGHDHWSDMSDVVQGIFELDPGVCGLMVGAPNDPHPSLIYTLVTPGGLCLHRRAQPSVGRDWTSPVNYTDLAAADRGQIILVGTYKKYGTPARYWVDYTDAVEPNPTTWSNWWEPAFDPDAAGWPLGTLSAGYDTGGSWPWMNTAIDPDPLALGSPQVHAVFSRVVFSIPDQEWLDTFQGVTLACDYDDALRVWLNGVEIGASANAPAGGGFNLLATVLHAAAGDGANDPVYTTRAVDPGLLAVGPNVLAVGNWNNDTISSDLAAGVQLSLVVANNSPVAHDQPVSVEVDTPQAITLTADDADGHSLTYSIVAPPTEGALSGAPPDVTYTPAPSYIGPDSFTFQVNDGALDSNVATVSVTVTPPNPTPPIVTLVSPADQSTVNTINVSFTCSATDDYGLLEATLYVGGGSQTVSFSGASETDDAQISATAPDTKYGSALSINVDGASPHAHGVIKFPALLGSGPGQVPPGASIVSATLEINCTNPGDLMKVYRLTEDWVESQVTWNERAGGTPWTDAGADGPGSNAGVSLNWLCNAAGLRTLDITQFVQEWSDGAPNYGIVLTDTNTDGIDFDSSESGNPPELTVTYQVWNPVETQPMSGLSDTATFNTTLTDGQQYVWNCLVTNTSALQAWAPANFTVTVDASAPDQPVLVRPADGATGVDLSPTLEVTVSDTGGGTLDVTFYGRPVSAGGDFTIVAVPDTQNYSAGDPDTFTAQTQWIVDNVATRNIVFVTHEGDIVNTWDSTAEWTNANASMSLLDGVVPYGFTPGNRDMDVDTLDPENRDSTYYNQTFPYTRYDSQPWYGGHYAGANDNSYQLISAGGEDLLILHLEYAPRSAVIQWADQVLEAHADRRAIITTHGLINASGGYVDSYGIDLSYIWDDLVVPNDNVYFVVCGHAGGEYTRTEVVNGRQVHQLLACYHGVKPNGGDGWLRILGFAPSEDKVYVQTYSPKLDQYETDADSEFTLDFPMNEYTVIGAVTGVASGSNASVVWAGLAEGVEYEWYAAVTNTAAKTTLGPVWRFTTSTNQPPVAADDAYGVDEDDTLNVAAPGVLGNDSDPESDPLTAVLATDVANGTLTLNPDGSFSYTPAVDFNGTDSFTYTANDGSNDSNVATVTITVNAVNDAPVANDDTAQTDEDTPVAITLTASDADNDPLTYNVLSGPGSGALSGTAPNLTYTPNENFNGADSFTFEADDGQANSNVATVTITVDAVNDPPVADNQMLNTDEDQPLSVTLTAGDVEGDDLTYAVVDNPALGSLSGDAPDLVYTPNSDVFGSDSFTFKANDGQADGNIATITIDIAPVNDPPTANDLAVVTDEDTAVAVTLTASDVDGDALTFSVVTGPANGTLSGTAPDLTYTPNADYNGPDSFTFTANDGTVDSNVATVSITVNAVNDAPVADDQAVATDEDVPVAITLTGSDVDGDTLTFSVVSGPSNGTLSGTAPDLTYTPNTDYHGPDSFTFTANDGTVDSNVATVSITVNGVNDAPVADDQSVATDEDVPVAITLTGSDVDGDTLTFSVVTGPANGTLSGTAPNLTYTPNADYNGPDSFTFTANDGTVDSNIATVSITVNAVNDAPVADDQSVATDEDIPVAITLTGSDVDGDTLTFSVVSGPSNGTLSGTAPNLTYTPGADYNGPDSITFAANDGTVDSNVATVSITVNAVNDAPVADDQSVATDEDVPVAITLTGSDVDGDTLTFTVGTGPSNGTLSGTAPNLTYTPDANYNGADSFTFKVNDGSEDSAVATVMIDVTAVNDTPVADDQSVATDEDTAVAITLTGSDVDGDSLTYGVVSGPSNGTLSGTAPNLTYTPNADYNGADSFSFQVNDGTEDSAVATVTIDVTAVNDTPVADDQSVATDEDTPVAITLTGSDVDGDTLTFSVVSGPSNGTLSGTAPDLTYTPNADYNGPDSFTFTANDGTVDSNIATVSITVNAVNDAPVADDQSVVTDEDTAVAVTLTGSDVDGDTLTFSVVTGPGNGTLSGTAPNLTYTPDANYSGADSFSFKVNDGTEDSAVATVTIDVTAVNDAPVADDQSVVTDEDTAVAITLTGSDVDGDSLTYGVVSGPSNGTLSGTAPNLTYTPNANFNGSNGFTFKVNDGTEDSAVATVTINVTAVNDAPVANSQSVDTNEDTAVAVTLTGSDVDGDTLAYSVGTGPSNGTLSGTAPDLTYTPNANYNGSDGFTFKVNDGTEDSAVATVTIDVTPVNDPPVANDDSAMTDEDTAVTINVLANDTDLDVGDTLTVDSVVQPVNGTVVINPDNTVTYTPDAGFSGNDPFTYTARDSGGLTDTATVTVKVNRVNNPPEANDDAASTDEDTATAIAVLGNDTDPDGDTLTVESVTQPANGTATINADNTITYTPNANYHGPDAFTYTVSDGFGGTDGATVNVTVLAVNDAPVAQNDSAQTDEDTPVVIGLLGNDTDVDGDTLNVESFTQPAAGVVADNGDGTVTYTPNTNYHGTDAFSYTVSDGNGGTDTAAVTVTVNSVNDAPSATDDSAATDEDTPVMIDLLANDSDADGDVLSVVSVTDPLNGTAVDNGDGTVTYTPDADFNGVDSFSYTISDGNGGTDGATVAVTVTPVNDAPVAVDDGYSVAEDDSLNVPGPGVLGNDSDVDGDGLAAILVAAPANGQLTLNGDGSFTYTPNADFNGSDSFTYTANDGQDNSSVATVTINVTPVNDAPVANGQSVATDEDTAVAITLTASDGDGDSLTFNVVSGPSNGTLSGTAPNLTYTPSANYSGPDSFTFTANDGTVDSNVATVSITVNGVNDAPVADDQSVVTDEDTAVAITLTASDADGDSLTFSVVSGPSNGTLSGTAPNLTYTPNANYSGPDSFTFKANDGTIDSNIATVSITVNGVNDAPVADDQSVVTDEDAAVAITLTASDADGDALTFSVVSGPSNGTLSGTAPNLTYTPNANYSGPDSFTFTANDGTVDSNIATVSITVNGVNDPPVAEDQSVQTSEDTPVAVTLTGSDADGDSLTFSVVSGPSNGTLSGTAPNLTYTPNAGFSGADAFTFVANDGVADSNVATVTVNVIPVVSYDAYASQDPIVTYGVLGGDGTTGTAVQGDGAVQTITESPNGTAGMASLQVEYILDTAANPADVTTLELHLVSTWTDIDPDPLIVSIWDGTAWQDITADIADGSFTPASDPQNYVNAEGNIRLLFTDTAAVRKEKKDMLTIDLLYAHVATGPPDTTPPVISSVQAVDVTDNAARIIWTTDEPADSLVDYGLDTGYGSQASDTARVTAHSIPLTGLSPETTYHYRVTSMDASGNPASSVDYTFTTPAGNHPPVANDDTAVTDEDTAVIIDLLANDSDEDSDPLAIDSVTQPANGSVADNGDGTVTYTPDADFHGQDSFSYVAGDGKGGTDSATVTVTVNPVNDAPVANDDTAATAEDTAVVIDVVDNDTDVDGDTLAVQSVTQPVNGSVVNNGDGTVTYTPNGGFSGTDVFTYTVSDGNGGTDTATVTVTVSSGQLTVHVASIDVALVPAGRNTKGQATVRVHDQALAAVPGATVIGNWTLDSVTIETGSSGITDANGDAILTSVPVKADSGQTYTFVVTDIVLAGYTYAPEQNVVTQGSIQVP